MTYYTAAGVVQLVGSPFLQIRRAAVVGCSIAQNQWQELHLANARLLQCAGIMTRLGKIYPGQPLEIKTRAELLASIKPVYWQHLRSDCGDLPMAIEPGLLAEPPKARVEQPVAG